jgi:hypothetical protein
MFTTGSSFLSAVQKVHQKLYLQSSFPFLHGVAEDALKELGYCGTVQTFSRIKGEEIAVELR